MIDTRDIYESSDSDDDIIGLNTKPVCENKKSQMIGVIKTDTKTIKSTDTCIRPVKYQKMKEVKNIKGFIVNVHDATNFDIDFSMKSSMHSRYQNVITNQYTYQELDNIFFDDPHISKPTTKIGTTYRCRLRGIGINQNVVNKNPWKNNNVCLEVKQLIDRTDGWVICTLSDIDVYQRILVDIFIPTPKEKINLKEFLLNKMEKEDDPIFHSYSGISKA